MKRLLSKKNLLGSAGLSLIELIISMAILAIVAIAVGGAMYVTSRSYKQNSAEINVQEEAQVASNLICDWLVDAQEVTPADGSATTLEIKHYEGSQLVVLKVFQSGTELKYEAKNDATGVIISSGVLATNVTGVNFNSKFDDLRNVRIAIDFDVNDRTYHSVTDSTSRNHDFIADVTGVNTSRPIIVFDIPPTRDADHFEVFLEPGQNSFQAAEYLFNATVYNYDVDTTFTVTVPGGSPGSSATSGDTAITIGNNGGTNVFPITSTTENQAKIEGTYTFTATKPVRDPANGNIISYLVDTKYVDVKIRRATECSFRDAPSSTGQNVEELFATDVVDGVHTNSGAVYAPVYVYLGDQTYPRVPGASYDNVFIDAANVKFEYRLSDGTDAKAAGYIDTTKTIEVTSGQPSVSVALAQSLPAGKDLYVIAVSTHQGDTTVSSGFGSFSATGDNKLRYAPYGSTGNGVAGWDYYDNTNQGVTWDYFKIKSPNINNNPQINFADLGICRNTPSFEMGHAPDSYLNWLKTYLVNTLHCNSQKVDSGFKYYTIIQYEEHANSHNWNNVPEYVLYKTDNFSNLYQHQNTQAWSHDDSQGSYDGHSEGFFFELDKAYDINVVFYVYDDQNNYVYKTSSEGSIPAAVPHIYDPWNAYGCFTENAYDGSTVTYTQNGVTHTEQRVYNHDYVSGSGNPANDFYIYFDSVNMNGNRCITFKFYEWVGSGDLADATDAEKADTNNWADVSSNFNGCYQTYMCETNSQTNGIDQVRLPNPPGSSNPYEEYRIKGYWENNYNTGDCGANVERICMFEKAPFMEGKDYRISFETSYPYVESSNITWGNHTNYNSAVLGRASGLTYDNYVLSNSTTNTGFIYVHGV